MVKKTINKRLIRMIVSTKGQYVAILVTIILGILIFIAMSMAANNLKTTLDTYYKDNNFGDFFVRLNLTGEGGLNNVEKIQGVKSVEGRINTTVPFVSGKEDERVNVNLISHNNNEEINKLFMIKGSFIKDIYGEALVISQFADARGIKPGDDISLQIDGKLVTLKVSGLVASPEFIYLMESTESLMTDPTKFGVVYISEELIQSLLGMNGLYNQLVIDYDEDRIPINNPDPIIEKIVEEIEKQVDEYGIQSVIHKKDQLSNFMISQEISQLQKTSGSIPIVFIFVAALILTMMINRMVKRDRGIIGIFKAIGYSNRDVIFHYTKYASFAGIIGGALGGIFGMASAGGMTQMYLQYFNIPLLRVNFDIKYVIIAMLMSATVCTIAGLLGARGITHINPAESMIEEPPKQGKRIFLERIPQIWRKLSFSWKLVYKNIFRNKKRTSLVIAGVVFTYGMMLFTVSMPMVMDDIMNKYFTDFMKMDYSVAFKRPIDKSAVYDFKSLGQIDVVEGKTEIPVELSNGNINKTVNLLAIEKDTVFYGFQDGKNNKVMVPTNGIIISENLATMLKVKKGDVLRIKPYTGAEPVYETVDNIISQSLGIGAYMNRDALDVRFLDKNLITGVNLKTSDPTITGELIKAKNVSTVSSSNDLRKMYDDSLVLIITSIGIMLIFSGILGFTIVYNVTTVNIGEREAEFSTLRVLGFSNNDIFKLILKENNIITIIGILLGIPVGIGMLSYSALAFSTESYTLKMEPTTASLIYAALSTVVFVLLAQAATYRKIKKLDFLQALKTRI